MTSDLQTQLFTTWLPLAIMVVFGIIGAFRGAVREAVLAAMVAIAAFIDTQWAIQWGQSFNDLYKGWPQQGEQFYISLVVLWAVALIVGYGLGSLVPRQPIRPQSRLIGLLLGLLSGAALAGWSLRFYITNTDGTLQPGVLLDSIVSRAFIIWATWFPLVLILLATIVVLVGPLRRMQGAVGEPSGATDWTPSAPARPSAGPALAAGYSPTGTAVLAYPPAQPGSEPAVSARAQGAVSAPQVPVAPFTPASSSAAPPASTYEKYGTYDNFDSTRTRAFTPQPEPPTTLLPTREVTSTTVSGPEESRSDVTLSQDSRDTTNYSTFDPSSSVDSSWLLHAVDSSKADAEATSAESPASTAVSEQTTQEVETITPVSAETKGEPQEEVASGTGVERACPNCGSTVIPGASFCTNCGTHLAS